MAIDIIEHDNPVHMIGLIDRINSEGGPWGVNTVKRKYLRPTTNEAFQMLVTSILQSADEAHLFFLDDKNIYVVWRGRQKTIYMQLRSLIVTTLQQPGLSVDPGTVAAYLDPRVCGDELKAACRAEALDRPLSAEEKMFVDGDDDDFDSMPSSGMEAGLKASGEQISLFREVRRLQGSRRQLQILVVEDHIFSQKLLCEVLRSFRMRNDHEGPMVDVTAGIQDAWKIFLKKAPDVVFIDLNLTDGSGHTLARAIREIDQRARVVIVTSNNYEEELAVARQNNVDYFITKPYNKKQILDCLASYVESVKQKGNSRAL